MNSLEQLIHAVQTARRMTSGLLEGLRDEDWLLQPVPRGQHALWVVGHLAIADDWGLVALGRTRQFTRLDAHFTRAHLISSDSSFYPPLPAVQEAFRTAHQSLVHRLHEISMEDLQRPTSGPIADFAPDLATLFMSHVWHEGFHGGQIALIRRSLGLPVRWG